MDDRLSRYISKIENHDIDFKRAAKLEATPRDLAKHLVAFANRNGGVMLFGITDEREIEGADIDAEESISGLSSVAADWTSPPISFTTQYYPSQDDGTTTGDVLEVVIDQAEDTPHAVASGNRVKRRYYIRSGDESRPVGNPKELDWLFTRTLPEELDYFTTVWQAYHENTRATAEIDLLPEGYSHLDELFSRTSPEDREFLFEGSGEHLTRFLTEIMPFALLLSASTDFWIGYTSDDYPPKFFREEIVAGADEVYIKDVDFESGPTVDDAMDSVVSQLDFDPIAAITEIGKRTVDVTGGTKEYNQTMIVPEGTKLKIEYVAEQVSRLSITNSGCFEFNA